MGKLRVYVPPSPLRLLEHVLDSPALVRAVRELPPAALGKLIDAIGLEDAGELVALATTSQLEGVFDEDLWKAERPGHEPHFDPARFGLWLQVLAEGGGKALVDRLCELPVDLVILAVSRLALVVDMDELWVELADDEEALELTEKAIDGVLAEEIEGFRLFSRDDAHFDVLVNALTALDREHNDILLQILEKAAAASSEFIRYNGGLYDVLNAEEMLESDAHGVRAERRGKQGFVAPSDARSFLALARQGLDEDAERDPVTRAYFRELERAPVTTPKRAPRHERGRADLASLARLLERANIAVPTQTSAESRALAVTAESPLLKLALAELAKCEPALHAERAEELAYLTNVIVAGDATANGRAYRPIEALERAITLTNGGLEVALAARDARLASVNPQNPEHLAAAREVVANTHLDRLFRLGLRRRET